MASKGLATAGQYGTWPPDHHAPSRTLHLVPFLTRHHPSHAHPWCECHSGLALLLLGRVLMHMTGPSDLIFNWGDSHVGTPSVGVMYSLAHYFGSLYASVAQGWLDRHAASPLSLRRPGP